MKTLDQAKAGGAFYRLIFLVIVFELLAQSARADGMIPPGNYPPDPLASWSFQDTNNWTSDQSYAPISFTNISWSILGDGASLVVNTNDAPAYLDYYIYEPTNGATNLVLNSTGGSLDFWFAPNWSSGTNGGAGPGQWAQLIDVGEWTADSSVGYFGLSIDPTGSNIVFASQDGAGNTYDLSAPISWMTNIFNHVALTYSSTNVSLYLNGQLVTNDPGGLSIWPPPTEQAVWFGSDTNGNEQAQGLFNNVETYNVVLDTNDVQQIYDWEEDIYFINPFDTAYAALSSAPSNPSTNSTPDVITGAGYLQSDGVDYGCSYSTNAYFVWITNIVTTPSSNGMFNVTFSINGGQSGYVYDVFAIGTLPVPLSSGTWSWMGQGPSCYRYTIPNVNSLDCFIILGTPQDSDGDGLTDAYELLVSHTDPHNADSNLDGILDGWEILLGLNPSQSNIGNSTESLDYGYTAADWIDDVSGIKGDTSVIMDNEGNVKQVSQ
jgi:hypothetical protein